MSRDWLNIRFGVWHLQAERWKFRWYRNNYHFDKKWWNISIYTLRLPM